MGAFFIAGFRQKGETMTEKTLRRRGKILSRLQKKQQLVRSAQAFLDACLETPEEAGRRTGAKTKLGAFFAALLGTMTLTGRAFASGESNAFGTVQRAVDFLMNILMGVGVCFIAFGVISLAISFQSHDDSQKSKAVMAIVGGSIAVSVKYVLVALGINPNNVTQAPSA